MQASPSGPATPASQQSRHRSHRANMHQWRPRRATHTRTHTQTHTRTHIHAQVERKTHRKKVSHGAHRQPRCPMHHMCTTAARVLCTCAICAWNICSLQRGTNQSLGTNPLTSCTMQASPSGPATPASQQSRHRSHRINVHQCRRPRRATHTRKHTRKHTHTHAHTRTGREKDTQKESEPWCTSSTPLPNASHVHDSCTCSVRVPIAFGTCPLQRGANQSLGTNPLTN